MERLKPGSGSRYMRPTITGEGLRQMMTSETSKSKSMGGSSLASVRRLVNQSISEEIEEAFKEGRSFQEALQTPNVAEQVASSKFVFEQKSDESNSSQSSSIRTIPKETEQSKELLGEENLLEKHFAFQGKFMTDVETLSGVLNLASRFVDGILFDAIKIIQNREVEGNKDFLVPMKDICLKTEEALRDRPSVFDLAYTIVDEILTESLRRTSNLRHLSIDRLEKYSCVEDFKVKDGLEIVVKFINSWAFSQHWFYRMVYHGRQISEDAHSYFYTVRWSVPSPGYPVAQVTADVNFTVEVIPMKATPFYVEVWYRAETDRSQRSAFESKFLENWLKTIVKRKIKVYQMFKF